MTSTEEILKLEEERRALSRKIRQLKKAEKENGNYSFGIARLKTRSAEQIESGQLKYAVDIEYKKGVRHDTQTEFSFRNCVAEAETLQELYERLDTVCCHLMAILQHLEEMGGKT